MRALRVLIGIVVGAALAGGLLRAIGSADADLDGALRTGDIGDIRIGALWMAAIGVALVIVVVLGRSDPAIPLVCALGVLVAVGPAFFDLTVPTWLPSWLLPEPLLVLSPVFALVAGALVLGAAWGVGSTARGRQERDDA